MVGQNVLPLCHIVERMCPRYATNNIVKTRIGFFMYVRYIGIVLDQTVRQQPSRRKRFHGTNRQRLPRISGTMMELANDKRS